MPATRLSRYPTEYFGFYSCSLATPSPTSPSPTSTPTKPTSTLRIQVRRRRHIRVVDFAESGIVRHHTFSRIRIVNDRKALAVGVRPASASEVAAVHVSTRPTPTARVEGEILLLLLLRLVAGAIAVGHASPTTSRLVATPRRAVLLSTCGLVVGTLKRTWRRRVAQLWPARNAVRSARGSADAISPQRRELLLRPACLVCF